jgi:hypothetical protein
MVSVPRYPLLKNVHSLLPPPSVGETFLTRENFLYHHYNCDGFIDAVSAGSPSYIHENPVREILFLGLGLCVSDSSIDMLDAEAQNQNRH